MREFFPDALVRDYERLVPDMQNNPKDRHVLAAAVASRADYLVTFNLKHFPAAAVEQFDTAIVGPSTFLKNLWTQDQSVVEQRLKEQAVAIEISIDLLLERLSKSVLGFVKVVRGDHTIRRL
jgi:hypothetical protein